MSSSSADGQSKFHIAMVPWLAMGHLIPVLELSKCLARKGHHISFISTPRNIERLPIVPRDLSPLIDLVKFPLPHTDNLPDGAEATMDLAANMVHYLKKAFDHMESQFDNFLKDTLPDWIIYDFAANSLPPLAGKLGIPCIFFSLFNASSISFFGPPSVLMGYEEGSKTLLDLAVPPKWIPFPSKVVFRLHEIKRIFYAIGYDASSASEGYRLGSSIQGCDFVIIWSCMEFESDWLRLLEEQIYRKPVIPIGLLPPVLQESRENEVEKWVEISEWLKKQRHVAIGTEATLSSAEMTELTIGLELSELPFFWVLKKPLGSAHEDSFMLPDGFEDRISCRGFICTGWAPQVKILGHPSVGGFLTHCGWNSIIEGLSFGLPLMMFPLLSEQGLNARVLEEKKIGVEIPRDELDGSFTRDSVAENVRMVMINEEGKLLRTKALEMKELFGSKDIHDRYVDDFVRYLNDHKINGK